ncbi:MAG: hypothetical protein HY235_19065 [Acidobacteria bacterium]|nr:hypothetical protein [Acidobacteriota bacterium]
MERLLSLFGRHQLRCKECRHRFAARIWRITDLRYARCPQCYRMDLTTWSEEHYLPRFATWIRICFGAKRLRCEPCRLNFASFRVLRWKYEFPKKNSEGGMAEQAPEEVGA